MSQQTTAYKLITIQGKSLKKMLLTLYNIKEKSPVTEQKIQSIP